MTGSSRVGCADPCPECGQRWIYSTSTVLASHPPKYETHYQCVSGHRWRVQEGSTIVWRWTGAGGPR